MVFIGSACSTACIIAAADSSYLAYDQRGLLAAFFFFAAAIVVYLVIRRQTAPAMFFFADELAKYGVSWKSKLANFPRAAYFISLAFLILGLSDPRMMSPKTEQKIPPPENYPSEGIAVYLILDQSGSMAEEVSSRDPLEGKATVKKIDLLKKVTEQFVGERPNDLIGLVAFSRGAQVLSPLTLDHAAIIDILRKLDIQKEKDQDGTSIGYAIYKTASLIEATRRFAQELGSKGQPAYEIKNSIMILVTDGLQDPNPLDQGRRFRNIDIPEAAAYAKALGIKLYIVNIEPKLADEEFAANRNQMREAAESTGGGFFLASDNRGLGGIYSEINKLEKSKVPGRAKPQEQFYSRFSFYPYLLAAGMLFLFLAILLETTVLRRLP